MPAIWKRELQAYFTTPVGYIYMGVFLILSSVMFDLQILRQRSSDLLTLIGQMSYFWMLLSPVLTMRLLADERQKRTDQLLLTSPLSLPALVFGKYLAAVAVMLFTVALALLYVLIVAIYGRVYPGEMAVGLLGFILQGCAFLAIDLFVSGLVASPISAAVLGFGVNLFLWMLDVLAGSVTGFAASALSFFSLYVRGEPFLMGQLSCAGIFFFVAISLSFLLLTIHTLDSRRYRGEGGRAVRGERQRMPAFAERNLGWPLASRGRKMKAMKKKHRFQSLSALFRAPRLRYGALSTALVCTCILVLLLGSLAMDTLEKKNGWRRDYSFNALLTTTETTRKVLDSLPYPVHIYALYERGQEDAPLLELLDRYAAASPLVTWEQTSVSLNPGLLEVFRSATSEQVLSTNQLVVHCPHTGRWRLLNTADFISISYNETEGIYEPADLNYEKSITMALSYVTRETVPRVMLLQGHGELDENGTALLASLLDSNSYDVYYFTLNHAQANLQPGDLLAILSPVRDMTDEELETVVDFATRGGSLLLTCDYSDPIDQMPNYQSLLRLYGFVPKSGMVLASPDEPATFYQGNRTYLIPAMNPTEITSPMVEGGDTFLIAAASRAFALPQTADRDLKVQPVLVSSSGSYLRSFSASQTSLSRQAGDEGGPFALALCAERITREGSISRAFVLGASTMLTNESSYAMTVCQEFIIRTVEYLLREESAPLDIIGKVALRPQLSAASVTLGRTLLVLLPLSVLGSAFFVLSRRKNR